jgi:hypothetical protein
MVVSVNNDLEKRLWAAADQLWAAELWYRLVGKDDLLVASAESLL